jgi:SAM-dependent methyltransferase
MSNQGQADIHDAVSRYYQGKLREHGATSRGVDWRDETSHALRHEQFLYLLGDDHDATIGDLGCGYGHFLPFLRKHGFNGTYTGYDVAPEMVAEAKRQHGESPAIQWRVSGRPSEQHDYIIASGIFNVRQQVDDEKWTGYIFNTIDEMAAASSRGFAFNILTLVSDPEYRRPDLYYADPARFMQHCIQKYGRLVAVLHDSGLYEFTLIVRKSS